MARMPGEVRRDASKAWSVLTRDQQTVSEPDGFFARWWYRTRLLYGGLSSKLSPSRRVVFVSSIILAVIGLSELRIHLPGEGVLIAGGKLPLLLAVAGFVLLLTLELADRVLVRDELEVARELQRDLLPARAPELPGYEFAFSYQTANTIGGDYFDFLPAAGGRLAVLVGDASGHGIAAGLLMAIASSALRTAIDLDPTPRAVVELVHRALYRTGGPRSFMTLFYGLLEPRTGILDYACAGHPYPLLVRRTGEVVELGSGSLPLGLRPEVEPAVGRSVVEPGSVLVLYSDGLPESLSTSGEAFGFERLTQVISSGGGAEAVHARLMRAVTGFAAGAPTLDDRSLVVIARRDDR